MNCRRPPFANQLTKYKPGSALGVYAGSNCWLYAPPANSTPSRNYLLLPPGKAASDFAWPVTGQIVLIIVRGEFSQQERAALAGTLLRDGATAGQFLDTGDWFGKLPADSLYWTHKKPAEACRPERVKAFPKEETL